MRGFSAIRPGLIHHFFYIWKCLYQVRNMTVLVHVFLMYFVIWFCHMIRDLRLNFPRSSVFLWFYFLCKWISTHLLINLCVGEKFWRKDSNCLNIGVVMRILQIRLEVIFYFIFECSKTYESLIHTGIFIHVLA